MSDTGESQPDSSAHQHVHLMRGIVTILDGMVRQLESLASAEFHELIVDLRSLSEKFKGKLGA